MLPIVGLMSTQSLAYVQTEVVATDRQAASFIYSTLLSILENKYLNNRLGRGKENDSALEKSLHYLQATNLNHSHYAYSSTDHVQQAPHPYAKQIN
jgi:hypothetical protein